MKALQVVKYGRPSEALVRNDIPLPEPGPGLVRIRVRAASLNFNDIDGCYGRHRTVKPPLPCTPGMDVCGEVDAAGEGAEHWIGRRVVAVTLMALGGYAEYALAMKDAVFEAPESLDDAEATSFLLPFHTTRLALHRRAQLRAGETLLVHSGASGLGSAAIQLGVAAGARVFATAGGPDKAEYCSQLGAEVAIDHRSEDFAERVFELTDGVGADVVCDLAGGDFTEPSWRCTAREGRYLLVGFADDPENGMTGRALRPAAQGNFSIVGVMCAWIDNMPLVIRKTGLNPFPRAVADEVHGDLMRLLSDKQIHPTLERRVSLDEAPAALEAHEARATVGRTAIVFNS